MNSGHDDKLLMKQKVVAWPLFCEQIFAAAINSVLPSKCLPPYLPDPSDYNAIKVIAVGKAAVDMATVVANVWQDKTLSGLIICPYGKGLDTGAFEVIESAHPLPDNNSVKAADRALEVACGTKPDELLLVLLSGGGSALMAKPIEGLSLDGKRRVIDQMLRGGATINELNLVRRALSAVKGGRLLAAAKAAKKVITLAISDVVNDEPTLIASGPTVPDAGANPAAIAELLDKYRADVPSQLLSVACATSPVPENTYTITANGKQAIEAAEVYLESAGYTVVNWGHMIEGEARLVANNHAEKVVAYCREHRAPLKPVAFLSGGELTVTVKGNGLGGPNQEYVLALMGALPEGEYCVFAADTDGVDGQGGASGAFFTPQSIGAAREAGLSADAYLNNNNSYNYFKSLNLLFNVKNKAINVNDIRVICWFPSCENVTGNEG